MIDAKAISVIALTLTVIYVSYVIFRDYREKGEPK